MRFFYQISSSETGSVLARAGDVEAQHAQADGHQAGAGEVLAALVQPEDEAHAGDNPAISEETGAAGGNTDHRLTF